MAPNPKIFYMRRKNNDVFFPFFLLIITHKYFQIASLVIILTIDGESYVVWEKSAWRDNSVNLHSTGRIIKSI